MGHLLRTFTLLLTLSALPAYGDLAVPAWYTEGSASWHYRLPVTPPAGAATGSTVHLDVDFSARLQTLGINASAVDFDERSVRVVGPAGTLVPQQQFTDRVYQGRLDPAGNSRGEVRFILETPGSHYLYFDITQNGSKSAAPATVINGRFEQSVGSTPTSWIRSSINANGAQNNEVYRTAAGSDIDLARDCGSNRARNLDTSPNVIAGNATGEAWLLLGYRDNCEDGSGNERIRLSRDFRVPAGAAAGVLEFYFQVQAFDGISTSSNYDWISFYVNGSTVDHNALSISNATSPQLIINSNRLGRDGYGNNVEDFGWKRAVLDLSAYAGSTINFRVETWHAASDNNYRTWVKLDDFVWSRQDATIGVAEGFGVNVVLPADTAVAAVSQFSPGQTLPIFVRVDAQPVSVRAEVRNDSGTLVASGISLFDDGSHGDVIANDGIWSNDGSDAGAPTYTIPLSATPGTTWLVQVAAPDASDAVGAVTDGLVLRPGQSAAPETQSNYYNIDAQGFLIAGARLLLEKTVTTLQDPIGGSQPKSLPGSLISYEVTVINLGPGEIYSDSVVLVDQLPDQVEMCVRPVCTCVGVCTPVDPVFFDDSLSALSTGLSYSYGSDVSYSLDGSDFSYTPVPDGAGFDGNVRYIRVNPTGTMVAPDVTGNPQFLLRYVVRLQ